MRVLTIIFTLYIGLLTVQPVLALVELTAEIECCDDNGEGCEDVCNPFLLCDCCIGFTASALSADFEPARYFDEPMSALVLPALRQPVFDIFQPPQLA